MGEYGTRHAHYSRYDSGAGDGQYYRVKDVIDARRNEGIGAVETGGYD